MNNSTKTNVSSDRLSSRAVMGESVAEALPDQEVGLKVTEHAREHDHCGNREREKCAQPHSRQSENDAVDEHDGDDEEYDPAVNPGRKVLFDRALHSR